MKTQKVDFLPDESQSEAELLCETKKLKAIFGDIAELAF